MKVSDSRSTGVSIRLSFAILGIAMGLSISAGIRAETIAGIDFDDDAFVDIVISSFGTFGPTPWFTGAVGADDSSAIIGKNINNFAHSLSNGSYIEIGFKDNAIVNGPGPDLGIFELGGILEPQFFTLTVADMLSSTNVVQVDTNFTGFTNNLGLNINYGTLDLSDLGVAPGAEVKSLVFTSVCDAMTATNTGGACMAGDQAMAAPAVIAAINSVYSGLDPLIAYDNFNAKKYQGCKFCLNTEKWIGLQRGDYNTEALREIKAKRLRMLQRTWGSSDSNLDTTQGRNRVRFRNSVNFSGVCFVPRISKYLIEGCDANPEHGHARMRYLGNFFDTGVADDADDGVIYAGIALIRHGDTTDKKGVFEISAWASECTAPDCSTEGWTTYDDSNDPDLFFGTVKASKNNKEICIGFDRDNHEMVFSYGKDIRIVDSANHDLPAFANDLAASQTWHVLEARNDVENCTTGKLAGYVDGYIDDVQIRAFPNIPMVFTENQWTIELDAMGPGVHTMFMIVDASPLAEEDIQDLGGRLIWNETEVGLCNAEIRGSGADFVSVGDGFESDTQGDCEFDKDMRKAFKKYGLPINACLTVTSGYVDYEYCAPLDQI